MPDVFALPKRWLAPPSVDAATVDALYEAIRAANAALPKPKPPIPRLTCALLVARGYTTYERAREFINPTLEQLHDPLLMHGVAELVERLLAARERGDTIGIHGDYDVDGLTSTTLLTHVLRELGFTVDPFVPHRMRDGYGVAMFALEQWAARGVRVVLTCDTGTSAVEPVRRAVEEFGMEVLVTDHHQPPADGVLAPAHVIVNPHQAACAYPFKHLCGAGVAFKVLQALARRLGHDDLVLLEPYLDLVAIGTIADVVSLTGENRVFAALGVKQAARTRNLGLRSLYAAAGVNVAKLSATTIGWTVGPRLNAVGRIEDAALGLELLLETDEARATEVAVQIEGINGRRLDMTKAIEQDAIRRVNALPLDETAGIVLWGAPDQEPAWHHGVLGIVASRIVERFGRPTVLLGYDPASDTFKGSGRAPKVGDAHLLKALTASAPTLRKYGGHQAAAGATVNGGDVAACARFATAFNAACADQIHPDDRVPMQSTDLEVELTSLTGDFYRVLRVFAPFGMGNETVTMVVRDVEVVRVRAVGKDGLKLTVRQNGTTMDAVGWGFASRFPEALQLLPPFRADLCVHLEENDYGGVHLELKLVDLRLQAAPTARNTAVACASPASGLPARAAVDGGALLNAVVAAREARITAPAQAERGAARGPRGDARGGPSRSTAIPASTPAPAAAPAATTVVAAAAAVVSATPDAVTSTSPAVHSRVLEDDAAALF